MCIPPSHIPLAQGCEDLPASADNEYSVFCQGLLTMDHSDCIFILRTVSEFELVTQV